jgi:hypothetical protein
MTDRRDLMSPYDDSDGSGKISLPTITEFNLMRRAARERWGVPDHLRTLALRDAEATYLDEKAGYRDRSAATRFLIEADKCDLDSAKFDVATYAAPPPTDDYELILDLAPADPTQQANCAPA